MYTDNERRVLKHLRMIDWENEVTADYAIKCLSSAWKIKFNRISALANLVAGLVEYQVRVLDYLCYLTINIKMKYRCIKSLFVFTHSKRKYCNRTDFAFQFSLEIHVLSSHNNRKSYIV